MEFVEEELQLERIETETGFQLQQKKERKLPPLNKKYTTTDVLNRVNVEANSADELWDDKADWDAVQKFDDKVSDGIGFIIMACLVVGTLIAYL